jgi:hypothetical protein
MSNRVYYMSVTQIQEAVENMVDSWDWNDLRQYIIEERMDYYCGNADKDEILMLIEDYGEKKDEADQSTERGSL